MHKAYPKNLFTNLTFPYKDCHVLKSGFWLQIYPNRTQNHIGDSNSNVQNLGIMNKWDK